MVVPKFESIALKVELSAKEIVNLILLAVARLVGWTADKIKSLGKEWESFSLFLKNIAEEADKKASRDDGQDAGTIGSVRLSMLRNGLNEA